MVNMCALGCGIMNALILNFDWFSIGVGTNKIKGEEQSSFYGLDTVH